MSFFSFFHFFSIYESPIEKKVDRFLHHIKKKSKEDLEQLMQKDLVRLTIFLEYKFKAYKKLKKSYRKKLYHHAELIKEDFTSFIKIKEQDFSIESYPFVIPDHLKFDSQFHFILMIMSYLKEGNKLVYNESCTFEKLLRNPRVEKLVGDCNQIVTLYIFLFSLRYPISSLQVKILPGHICLHYKGQDIEVTSGQLADYESFTFLSEVTEIVSANLLDISDPTEKQFLVSPQNGLRAAEFAYQFSSHRPTVEKNLFSAYHNLSLHFLQKEDFSQANLFANKSGNTKLQRSVLRSEGISLLKLKRYENALVIFRKINDSEGERVCYQNELSELIAKLKNLRTLEQYKKVKLELNRMKELAIKLGNTAVLNSIQEIMKKF